MNKSVMGVWKLKKVASDHDLKRTISLNYIGKRGYCILA